MLGVLCETDTSEPAAILLISSAGVHSLCHHTGDGVRWKDLFKGSRHMNNEAGARMTDLQITDLGISRQIRHPRQLFQLQFETPKAWKIWELQLWLMAHLFHFMILCATWPLASAGLAILPHSHISVKPGRGIGSLSRCAIVANHHRQVHRLYLLLPLNYI